jgi:hypothetical protein
MKAIFPLIALEDEYVCSDCLTSDMLQTQEKDGDRYRFYVMCQECGYYLEIQNYTVGKHECPNPHCKSDVVLEVRERKDRIYNNYLLCNNCSFRFGEGPSKKGPYPSNPPASVADTEDDEEITTEPTVNADLRSETGERTDITTETPEQTEAEIAENEKKIADLLARHSL